MSLSTNQRIFLITALICIIALAFLYFLFHDSDTTEPKPTPGDLKKIEVLDTQILSSEDGIADIFIEVRNPNSEWGAQNIVYNIDLLNEEGDIVRTLVRDSYILPDQQKFLVHPSVRVSESVVEIRTEITVETWRQLEDFVELRLYTEDVELTRAENQPEFSTTAKAFVVNDSLFGLNNIDIPVVLKDKNDNVLAVNRTSLQTVLAGEKRLIEVFWRQEYTEGEVGEIIIDAYTNIFANDNFIRRYGGETIFNND